MRGGAVLNITAHAASGQNIYWKLRETQTDIHEIKDILNQNFPLPQRYERHIVNIKKVNPIEQFEPLQGDDGLSSGRYELAATTLGDYVIVAGGGEKLGNTTQATDAIDIFQFNKNNGTMKKVTMEDTQGNSLVLKEAKQGLSAVTVGNYALFAGSFANTTTVDIFKLQNGKIVKVDTNGTAIANTDESGLSLSKARGYGAAVSIGNYAIFAGGTIANVACDIIDIFKVNDDGTVNRIDAKAEDGNPLTLSEARYSLAATTIGDYAIFAGYDASIDVLKFNKNTGEITKLIIDSNVINLNDIRHYLAATSIKNYAIFAGGAHSGNFNTVDIFKIEDDGRIVKVVIKDKNGEPLKLNEQKSKLAAATIGDYAIFAGGMGGNGYINTIDVFHLTSNGTIEKIDMKNEEGGAYTLQTLRQDPVAISINNYVLFIGGTNKDKSEWPTNIDAFRITKSQLVPFVGLNPDLYITTDIVLDKDDEQLAEYQLCEWGKISHIEPRDNNLIVRYFHEQPDIPLDVRVTVWHP